MSKSPQSSFGNSFDLERFVAAQEPLIETVRAELTAGRKTSHWMWFVFPQIQGLGHSAMSRLYAIRSLDEARAYLQHPILGPRINECAQLVNLVGNRSIERIFGSIDAQKFYSSMTLFSTAEPGNPQFTAALDNYYEGRPDPGTLAILNGR